ncbi:hypothetical protein AGLY_008995 [Aphis glycines]|uniref:Uncharacterized protein n=1 Tax=Aphis glycines TaxID=307491 RepID=A0A6G0TK65_APHGL|nr:hypothetical protein AGLY_008995 [Aphis glycines]
MSRCVIATDQDRSPSVLLTDNGLSVSFNPVTLFRWCHKRAQDLVFKFSNGLPLLSKTEYDYFILINILTARNNFSDVCNLLTSGHNVLCIESQSSRISCLIVKIVAIKIVAIKIVAIKIVAIAIKIVAIKIVAIKCKYKRVTWEIGLPLYCTFMFLNLLSHGTVHMFQFLVLKVPNPITYRAILNENSRNLTNYEIITNCVKKKSLKKEVLVIIELLDVTHRRLILG